MKKSIKIINKKTRFIISLALVFVIGGISGVTAAFLVRNHNPQVLVWTTDKSIKAPDGLVSYIENSRKGDCESYKGTSSAKGKAVFAIFESAQNRLAKISYGCGDNLSSEFYGYIFAVRTDTKWKLFIPQEYLVNLKSLSEKWRGPIALPSCKYLNDNDVPVSFESLCVGTNHEYITR